MDIATKTHVSVGLNGIELIALKKLSLVSHALAQKIGGRAGDEQKCLAGVLDDVIRQFEIGAAVLAGTTSSK